VIQLRVLTPYSQYTVTTHTARFNIHEFYVLPIYLLNYVLTPWNRVLLETLTASLLVKKFPAFHGIRKFITEFKSVRHLSLS